jgi:hypothetical protein
MVQKLSKRIGLCLLPTYRCTLLGLLRRSLSRHVSPKCRLPIKGPYGVVSQEMKLACNVLTLLTAICPGHTVAKKTKSLTFDPQENYTDRAPATWLLLCAMWNRQFSFCMLVSWNRNRDGGDCCLKPHNKWIKCGRHSWKVKTAKGMTMTCLLNGLNGKAMDCHVQQNGAVMPSRFAFRSVRIESRMRHLTYWV